uniref:CXXC-type domain-containing protein n=1 Tax=Glossina brevipalpis TaxID=37001 RepID=A0A1A9X4M6_9MUSC
MKYFVTLCALLAISAVYLIRAEESQEDEDRSLLAETSNSVNIAPRCGGFRNRCNGCRPCRGQCGRCRCRQCRCRQCNGQFNCRRKCNRGCRSRVTVTSSNPQQVSAAGGTPNVTPTNNQNARPVGAQSQLGVSNSPVASSTQTPVVDLVQDTFTESPVDPITSSLAQMGENPNNQPDSTTAGPSTEPPSATNSTTPGLPTAPPADETTPSPQPPINGTST